MKASQRIRQISVAIDESAVDEDFILASGPGGQAVQKQSTAVKLHYDLNCAAGIDDHMRRRLKTVAGKRLRRDGVLVITAQRYREQERNRADARARLVEILRRAATPKAPRRATKIPKASKRKRLENKKRRAEIKRGRGRPE